jgi:hypothetical protein
VPASRSTQRPRGRAKGPWLPSQPTVPGLLRDCFSPYPDGHTPSLSLANGQDVCERRRVPTTRVNQCHMQLRLGRLHRAAAAEPGGCLSGEQFACTARS